MQNAEDPSPRALSLPSDDAKKARLMGYGLLAITMFIWGSFTLISRLGATQSMTAWDISALRLFTASIVLIPIQILTGVVLLEIHPNCRCQPWNQKIRLTKCEILEEILIDDCFLMKKAAIDGSVAKFWVFALF